MECKALGDTMDKHWEAKVEKIALRRANWGHICSKWCSRGIGQAAMHKRYERMVMWHIMHMTMGLLEAQQYGTSNMIGGPLLQLHPCMTVGKK